MSNALGNFRYSLRSLRRTPGFTIVAVLSLAIGIGANSAVFSAASGLLLHPLPYDGADRIVAIWQRSPGIGVPQDWLSTGQYLDIAAENSAFEATAATIGVSFNLTGSGSPERIDGIRVSSSFFNLFGTRPLLGTTFGAEYDRPGRPPTALLTYGFWVRRFGADRSVVGKTLTLNGTSVLVAGVLSPDFVFDKDVMYAVNGIQRTDIVLPLPMPASARDNRNGEDFNVFAKLRRGGSVSAAQAVLDGIAARMKRQYPQFYPAAGGLTLSAVPLVHQVVGSMRTALYILIGAVGLVLLIACANVANLILSRAASQERDLAVRVAIGASGSQIVGGVMAEGALLAIAGVLAGLVIAFLSVVVLHAAGPDTIPRLREIVIDWRVLAFTAAVASVALLLFAVPPALRAARVDAGVALKAGARGSQPSEAFGIAHGRLQRFLIVSEVTLATVLLVGAGLLLRSYANIRRADPGFQPKNVTTLRLSLPAQQYKGAEAISRFYDDLARRLRSVPGVTAVGMNYQLPLSSVALAWEPVGIEGYVPKGPGDDRIISSSAYVTEDYFRAMGIPLSRGRFFTNHDVANAPEVVIVDDKFAQRFWPNEDALGKRIRQGTDGPWRTVVGIVRNTKEYQPDAQPPITAYFPVEQYAIGSRFVVIRTDSAHDAAELMRQVQREVRASDPQLPIYDAHTMLDRLDGSLTRRRLTMSVLAAFAVLALVLSGIGTHGVIAYWVGRRRKEIGIRMALGADLRRITILLAREFGPAITTGVVLGMAGAVAGGRVLRSLLFGVRAADAPNLAAAFAVVMIVAIAAIFIPARRAAGTSPALAIQRD